MLHGFDQLGIYDPEYANRRVREWLDKFKDPYILKLERRVERLEIIIASGDAPAKVPSGGPTLWDFVHKEGDSL